MTQADPELLAALASVLARGAADAFVAGPLIVHDEVHFPDAWTADLVGVRAAIRRMLMHAGLPQVRVELEDEREGEADGVDHGVHLVDLQGHTAVFAITSLPPPKYLVAAIGLEVARVWIELAATSAAGPYRGGAPDDEDIADDTTASLVMFALGLGVLAVNGSGTLLKSESVGGGYVIGRWQQLQVGGLAVPASEELLAVQLAVRGVDDDALAPIRAALGPDHVDAVVRRLGELRPQAAALREALGLPEPDAWPEAWAPNVGPLPDVDEHDVDAHLREHDAAYREQLARPNAGTAVFRARQRQTMTGLVLGAIAGIVAAIVVPGSIGIGLLTFAAVATAGTFLGRAVRASNCADPNCNRRLRPDDRTCPGCGGTIVGVIDHRDERLAALERWEAEQGSLAAGD